MTYFLMSFKNIILTAEAITLIEEKIDQKIKELGTFTVGEKRLAYAEFMKLYESGQTKPKADQTAEEKNVLAHYQDLHEECAEEAYHEAKSELIRGRFFVPDAKKVVIATSCEGNKLAITTHVASQTIVKLALEDLDVQSEPVLISGGLRLDNGHPPKFQKSLLHEEAYRQLGIDSAKNVVIIDTRPEVLVQAVKHNACGIGICTSETHNWQDTVNKYASGVDGFRIETKYFCTEFDKKPVAPTDEKLQPLTVTTYDGHEATYFELVQTAVPGKGYASTAGQPRRIEIHGKAGDDYITLADPKVANRGVEGCAPAPDCEEYSVV